MDEDTCPSCGGRLDGSGNCASCGYSRLVELEIGAFMGPAIKRARIVLFVLGALFLFFGVKDYSTVATWRQKVQSAAASDPNNEFVRTIEAQVTWIYIAVAFSIVAGVANMLLALAAGKKTMIAFYGAAALFAVYTLIQIKLTAGLIFFSLFWWCAAGILGMGFMAALKAEKLRSETAAGRSAG